MLNTLVMQHTFCSCAHISCLTLLDHQLPTATDDETGSSQAAMNGYNTVKAVFDYIVLYITVVCVLSEVRLKKIKL